MSIGDKRRRFTHAKSLLVQYAIYRGWELAEDFSKRCDECPVGHERSLHKLGLASDLNLYIDGRYIRDSEGHDELHDFWDLLGGAERISNDMNHYSFAHGGMR